MGKQQERSVCYTKVLQGWKVTRWWWQLRSLSGHFLLLNEWADSLEMMSIDSLDSVNSTQTPYSNNKLIFRRPFAMDNGPAPSFPDGGLRTWQGMSRGPLCSFVAICGNVSQGFLSPVPSRVARPTSAARGSKKSPFWSRGREAEGYLFPKPHGKLASLWRSELQSAAFSTAITPRMWPDVGTRWANHFCYSLISQLNSGPHFVYDYFEVTSV